MGCAWWLVATGFWELWVVVVTNEDFVWLEIEMISVS